MGRTTKKTRKGGKKRKTRTFTFQLSPAGIVAIAVVCFCLFFWMFLLGIWAGQTILFPVSGQSAASSRQTEEGKDSRLPIKQLRPASRKRPVHHP